MSGRKIVRRFAVSLGFVLCVLSVSSEGAEKELWIEAESLDVLGGWLIDQQSMDQMGSAYVMAHGMGVPVVDAETTCTIPESGEWTVWVRTRDWTAPWKRGKPGGVFKISINEKTMPETLGTSGAKWAWQKAGAVGLEKGNATVGLHDLTGFNGRCDAIYLRLDPEKRPADDGPELADFPVCQDLSSRRVRLEIRRLPLQGHRTPWCLSSSP